MRKPFIAGNWKMHGDLASALALAAAVREHVGRRSDVDVAVAPPFVHLQAVAEVLARSLVRVGAQNMCAEPQGAFTGEISGAMLRDVGATFVILGHSERRHVFGESDALVNAKVRRALEDGLDVVLCVGETRAEREAKETERVVHRQLTRGLEGVADVSCLTIAYEPVWAIGTGLNATPEQAGEVHTYLRGVLEGLYGEPTAETTRIQYGGSVKPGNIAELMAVEGIDGALVGGASLDLLSFAAVLDFDR